MSPRILAVLLASSLALSAAKPPSKPEAAHPCLGAAGGVPLALARYLDPQAGKYLDLIRESPADSNLRQELSTYYRGKGWGRAAWFFGLTVEYLRSRGVTTAGTVAGDCPLRCEIRVDTAPEDLERLVVEVRAAQESVARAEELDQGSKGTGLAATENAIEIHGAFCPLVAEWASAYLWYTAFHPTKTHGSVYELAIRSLLSLTDKNEYPVAYEGSASVYFLLSEMFAIRNDYIGSFVALEAADREFRSGSVTGSIERTSFKEMLAERIGRTKPLAEKQRRGER
jgi:hypothetical protein